jgi:predicted amidohydrolase
MPGTFSTRLLPSMWIHHRTKFITITGIAFIVLFKGVQFKVDKNDFRLEHFKSHIESFYAKTEPGETIVFPEDIGLNVAFEGLESESIADAIRDIYSTNSEYIDSIMKNLGGISLTSALFLSLTDRFARDFYDLFASLSRKYSVYTIACNNMAEFEERGGAYYPVSARVFNTAYVFNTRGELAFRQRKVFLTQMEIELGISPGKIEDVSTFKLEGLNVGIATSLDAFMPEYVSRLLNADVVIQPDANPGKWNGFIENGRWQPEEWMESSYYIAQRVPRVRYVLNPMMVGRMFEISFEGQSNITKKSERGDKLMSFIGNIPTKGFHSIIGIAGMDPEEFIRREEAQLKELEFAEGMVEVEI